MDAELAYLGWLSEEEKTRQQNMVLARNYYEGEHNVPLTERQQEFLGFNDDERFALNYCATVVDAVVERLLVAGFSSATDEALAELAWAWWQANRMDAVQGDVHLGAVRDGEYFVMVDWDAETSRPRLIPHPRYTDPQVDGTGFGCKAFYPDGDPAQPMAFASKRWTERTTDEQGNSQTRRRMTVYYPERVERYVAATKDESGWEPYVEEGKSWPVRWVDGQGRPLGIPVVHFRNPQMRTELWDAIPIQDAVNKTALDTLAAADACGFRILIAKGFTPTTDGKEPESDGGNYLKIFPGAWIGPVPEAGAVDVVEAADLEKMIGAVDSWIVKLAQVTDTPISRLQVTRQVAAEGTLKQQEEPLLAKVRARQTLFGNGWEDALYMARRLANAFGGMGLDEEALLGTQWKPAETRDEEAHLKTLKLKGELGVPAETLWAEMGYSQEEIAKMRAQRGEELTATSNVGGELLRAFERGGMAGG